MSVRSLNKVMLIGNLTRDPEIRYTNNGATVVSFGLATNKSWKNPEGEIQESTEFHNIVAWGKMAEICQQLLAKGMKVFVEGSMSTRSWEDESGGTRYKTEVRVNEMILLDSKGKAGAGIDSVEGVSDTKEPSAKEEVVEEKPSEENSEDVLDDDLPF
jgi:single-strand DNA-binding protein